MGNWDVCNAFIPKPLWQYNKRNMHKPPTTEESITIEIDIGEVIKMAA